MLKNKYMLIVIIAVIVALPILFSLLYFKSTESKQAIAIPPFNEAHNDKEEVVEPLIQPLHDETLRDTETNLNISPEHFAELQQAEAEQLVLQLLDNLSLEQKIGQLFILGFEGKTYGNTLESWLIDYYIGSFILFKRNIESDEQLQLLIQEIDKKAVEQLLPTWIGIDQEGGKVNRLPKKYPEAMDYALWNDTSITYQNHHIMAEHLIELGIDINFGPVLDIHSNEQNPVIGTRAFGTDAKTVVAHSSAAIDAYQQNRLVSVGKHFPGHGDTNTDSHYELPFIDKKWEELLQLELIPFQNAIAKNIDAIMVGHLLLKQIDSEYPASISYKLMTEKLRNELGFTGLIVTDDLIMKGILSNFSIEEAAVLAITSGADMLIIGHEQRKQLKAIEAVTKAVQEGIISEQMLNDRVARILQYKLSTLTTHKIP